MTVNPSGLEALSSISPIYPLGILVTVSIGIIILIIIERRNTQYSNNKNER